MKYIDPHIHMVSRTTDDYQAMARAGCVAVTEPAFWAGFDRAGPAAFESYFEQLTRFEPGRAAQFGIRHFCWLCINPKEAEDLYGLREALEVHAIRTARITPRVMEGLRAHLRHMRDHYEANAKLPWIEEDAAFHNAIADAAGNKLLLSALENLQHQLWLFRRTAYDLSSSKDC